jgi:hypothetical protein
VGEERLRALQAHKARVDAEERLRRDAVVRLAEAQAAAERRLELAAQVGLCG